MVSNFTQLEKNKLALEITRFFYQNQTSIDTVSGIAAWVQEDKKKVKKALDLLVKLGVLEQDSEAGTNGYSYTRDEKIMKRVRKIMRKK